jgi:hypothetical protein
MTFREVWRQAGLAVQQRRSEASATGVGKGEEKEEKKMSMKLKTLLVCACALAGMTGAHAAILFQNLGTAAPPAAVGGIPVTPFAQLGTIGCYDNYTSIPGCPIPGSMTASPAIGQTKIGTCWATWSHGYTGDVYYSNGATTVVLTMPAGTTAFYLYVEPNPFSWYDITAVTDTGTTSGAIPVNGSAGANGFAFYTDGSDTIATVTISSAVDFALGEFGISNVVPFDVSFLDDYGREQFCASTKSGAYKWTILSGPWTGMVFTGTASVFNAGGKFTSKPGDSNYFSLVYDPVRHKASGWLITGGRYFKFQDANTLDDPPGCPDLQGDTSAPR